MPGLVPGSHDLRAGKHDVDGRDKPGHDECAEHGATTMTRNNILYLIIGALVVGTAVLGYQFYQERQKPGLSISIGGKEGLKIEGK